MLATGRRTLRLTKHCDVRRFESANGNPVTVAANVNCSSLYPASLEAAERANMATVARALTVYVEPLPSSAVIERDWRIVMSGNEYRIRGVSPWPWDDPVFWELLVEDEG